MFVIVIVFLVFSIIISVIFTILIPHFLIVIVSFTLLSTNKVLNEKNKQTMQKKLKKNMTLHDRL